MDGERLLFEDRDAWREWLSRNHQRPKGLWVILHKKGSKGRSVSYEEAVQEALCFGWIDSLVNRWDEERYLQWFSPRRRGSTWSARNIARAKELIAAGKMTEAGKVKLPEDLDSFRSPDPIVQESAHDLPHELAEALDREPEAKLHYENLTSTDRRRFHIWIQMAKRPETKAKRVAESIRILREGRPSGQR
jgi:uncharacterized protein YdeI (YjbR/CyaY-like superfamily)